MNPPIVYEVTKPSAQRTSKMTAMVQSIFPHPPPWFSDKPSQKSGIPETTPPDIPWSAPGGMPPGLDPGR
jgi:hypothetical protein